MWQMSIFFCFSFCFCFFVFLQSNSNIHGPTKLMYSELSKEKWYSYWRFLLWAKKVIALTTNRQAIILNLCILFYSSDFCISWVWLKNWKHRIEPSQLRRLAHIHAFLYLNAQTCIIILFHWSFLKSEKKGLS